MSRWILSLLLVSVCLAASTIEAAGPAPRRHPPHWRYGSFGVWVKTNGPGYPAYRYTYRGAAYGAPLPAIYQYGSEHTNYVSGPGF